MKSLKSGYIIGYIDSFDVDRCSCLVMELANGKDLDPLKIGGLVP